MKKTITVDLDVLRDLLTSTAPFADKLGLDVLRAVELRGAGQYLVASATDRYVAAIKRAEVADSDGFYALLPIDEIRHLLATFKTTRAGGRSSVELTAEDDRLQVSTSDGLFAGVYGLTATYRLLEQTFPDVTKIMDAWKPGESGSMAYNPELLARFQAATERRAPLHLMPGQPGKPSLVLSGDLIGLLMPMKVDAAEAKPDPASWLSAIRPVKAVTK